MKTAPLMRLCESLARGATPSYAEEGDRGCGWILGQSCVRPGGEIDLARTRRQATDAGIPTRGRLTGGEVIVNSTGAGTLGRVGLVPPLDDVTFADSHVTVLSVDPARADSRYVAYALIAAGFPRTAEQALGVGATKQLELNPEIMRRFRIPSHERHHQEAIADFLDAETARIDALVTARKRQSQLLAERFARVRAERLRDPADPLTRVRRTIAGAIGGVWGANPDGNSPTDRLVVRVADFDYASLGLRPEIPTMRSVHPSLFEQRELQTGDLLIEKSGGGEQQNVGRVVLVRAHLVNATCSNFIARLRPSESFDTGYLVHMHAWLYERGDAAAATNQTTGIQNLDLELYLDTTVPIPALQRQRVLAVELDLAMRHRDQCLAVLDRQITLLRERRQALITAAVSGRVDVGG